MSMYKHALVLLSDESGSQFLLQGVAQSFHEQGTAITVGRLMSDCRELDIVSDSLTKDHQSVDVIAVKAMLNRLVQSARFPVDVKEIVTIHRLRDAEVYVTEAGVDLVVMGYRNRLFGIISSHSIRLINHLTVDMLIKHITTH